MHLCHAEPRTEKSEGLPTPIPGPRLSSGHADIAALAGVSPRPQPVDLPIVSAPAADRLTGLLRPQRGASQTTPRFS
jgi:hypothetical protein